jgi:hypothetical protein
MRFISAMPILLLVWVFACYGPSAFYRAVVAAPMNTRATHAHTLLPAALASVPFGFDSPAYKRTDGRAPVWGSEFTTKTRTTGGGQQKLLG